MLRTLLAALTVAALSIPAAARADDSPFVQIKTGGSFLASWATGEPRPGTFGYGGTAGYRWDWFELGLVANHNFWVLYPADGTNSVLNIAAEAAVTSFKDRGRHAIAIGTSTLLFETEAAPAGHTGLYLGLTPLGLRLPLTESLTLEAEPLNFEIMAPVLDGIPLFQAAFRSVVGVGYEF